MASKNTAKTGPKIAVEQVEKPAAVAVREPVGIATWKFTLLLAILSFLVYANTLKNGFVYDDLSAITKNTIVSKGFSAIPEILATPYRRGYWVVPNDTYRPLSLVMFAVEYQFFGKNPAPGHFMNVLLYTACVILLFLFFDDFFERKRVGVAFIAALIFALHPIHTEVVANIKSRDELLCFFFAFLSLNVFLKYARNGKLQELFIASFCFLLALLSKETVISFVGVVALLFLFYKNGNMRRSIHIIAGTVVVTILFLAIRSAVLSQYHADQFANISFLDNSLVKADLPFAMRIASATLIMGYYVKLLFVPHPLIVDYSYNHLPFVSFSDPLALLSLALYVFLAVFAMRRFIKHRKDPYAFCILYFFITLSLYSNTFMLIAATLGERFLFFPSVGFCLAGALVLDKWQGGIIANPIFANKKTLAVIIPVCVVFAVLTINRNADWADNLTLYTADIEKAPQSVKLNYLLGMEYLAIAKEEKDPVRQQHGMADGIRYITKSLAIYPDYDDAQSELCDAYFRSARYDSAEVHGKLSLKLNPANAYTVMQEGD
jgi:hypothetical protein